MESIISLKYSIMDQVVVKSINQIGIIDGIILEAQGTQYRVVYWNDKTRTSSWMYEPEMREVTKEDGVLKVISQ